MQFLNFFFLFNCQVEFSNLYKNYFQKRHLLQAQTVFSTNCCKSLSKGFWIEKDIVSFYFFDSFTVAYPGLSLGIPVHETKVTRKLGAWFTGSRPLGKSFMFTFRGSIHAWMFLGLIAWSLKMIQDHQNQ